ncbi:MAG: ATP-binding protein [Acholeplasmatales bacterium]|nr:ATP-binding protein [Acholeplasmatales bacterium]
MIKMQFDQSSVDKYIEEVQKECPSHKITVFNVNDFAEALQQAKNCKGCKGLEFCKNPNVGFRFSFDKYENFELTECKYASIKRLAENSNSLIKTLYIPEKIMNATFADYELSCESRQKLYKKTIEFIQELKESKEVRGFYLTGSFGVGKTYTLACIANELARNGVKSLLIYFPDLVIDLKDSIGTSRFQDLMNMLKSIDVLMIDDLGSENMTPWLRDEVLGPILNYRLLENKPVFISSNLNYNELKAHLAIDKNPASNTKAERLVSRLQGLVKSLDMSDSKNYRK